MKPVQRHIAFTAARFIAGAAIAILVIVPMIGAVLAAGSPPTARTAQRHKASPAPSAFQLEQRMSFAQLMNRWNANVAAASKRFNVPASWIRAEREVESGGRTIMGENQPIKSSKGAMGLMQLMPSTYADMRAQYRLGKNPYDPADNIVAGAAYLKWLRGKYGYPQMFAAYNDGPGHLDARLRNAGLLPLETRNYLVKVTGVVEGRGGGGAKLKFTRPNGQPVMIDVSTVVSLRAAFPGEYAGCVQSVITVGRVSQGVCE